MAENARPRLYEVIYGTLEESGEFEANCDYMLQKGWRLHGPTSFVFDPTSNDFVFLQAFIAPEVKCAYPS